ncbi:MAG: CBS domain-containing protein [Deltaproteobacteria bacterium]|jgi:predicted transcriptional regulator|nr:CBS domain-containing protein [Deltaproteobacteria bacterium]
MAAKKTVKEIMSVIEEYNLVLEDDRLCEALRIIRENHKKIQACEIGNFHKTLFVKNSAGDIVGKLSIYDLIRGLVPESVKKEGAAKPYYRSISTKAAEVADEISEIQARFQWLDSSFFELVQKESQKKVRDVMSPIHPLLKEDDTINRAIYLMFKENTRQPLVVREGKIVGVVTLMDIFPELLEIAGDECFWEGIA